MADVLITLGIIGVVAAITLPALITNIQDRVKEKRVQNIQQKFSKATDKMLSVSGLNGYDSTLDFVNELKNHLSIAKICENDELRNCWPTEKVTLADGSEWEISKTTKAKNLKMEDKTGQQWDDTVGLITGDGTSIILSYNKLCNQDPVSTPSWDTNRSSSTSCVAAIYDWNGSAKPNKLSNTGDKRADVMLLNAGGLGESCAIEVNGLCLSSPVLIADEYPNGVDCATTQASGKYGNFDHGCSDTNDYWMAGVVYCGGKNKVASEADLQKLSDYIYGFSSGTTPADGYSPGTSSVYQANARKTSLGFPVSDFWVWSSSEHEEYSFYAYGRYFYNRQSSAYNTNRTNTGGYVLCKGD